MLKLMTFIWLMFVTALLCFASGCNTVQESQYNGLERPDHYGNAPVPTQEWAVDEVGTLSRVRGDIYGEKDL